MEDGDTIVLRAGARVDARVDARVGARVDARLASISIRAVGIRRAPCDGHPMEGFRLNSIYAASCFPPTV